MVETTGFLEDLGGTLGLGGGGRWLIILGCELTERGDVAEETVVSHFPVVFTLLDSSISVSNSKGAVESKHQSYRKKDLSRWEQRFHIPSQSFCPGQTGFQKA